MNAKDGVITAEQQMAQAHLEMNLEVIARFLHDDYVVVQPGGRLETKADVLHAYQHEIREWYTAEVDQVDVRLYGETAVVIGRWRATGQNNGVHFDYAARFLSVWVWSDDRWQNVAYQATEINQS
ncbi:MAG: nuclear transport factor 2 family protein [Anaerolineales bacterium]|nr:nuclear transport factor 2 family protein [Anaerolineales bacterium]